jgi:hypothetical protein
MCAQRPGVVFGGWVSWCCQYSNAFDGPNGNLMWLNGNTEKFPGLYGMLHGQAKYVL